MAPSVRVFPSLDTLSRAVADNVAELIRTAVDERGRFSVALAGGNTPKALYECLATDFSTSLPWSQVHLFWGDERYVPPDHPQSNFRMVRDSLLNRIAIPAENIHPMPTYFPDPADAVHAYLSTLKNFFATDGPSFDLVLLGMGADGHTASLFPNTAALMETSHTVVSVQAPVEPSMRLSLTMPTLVQGRAIYFLIAGKDKAVTLKSLLEDPDAPTRYPARRVFDAAGSKLVCWADDAAVSLLSDRKRE